MIYRPENYQGPIAQDAKIGVKFSNDIFLLESFLKQFNVEYKQEDLVDSPFGRGVRIKRDELNNYG